MRVMYNPAEGGLMVVVSGFGYDETSQPTFALANHAFQYVDGNVGWNEFSPTLDGQTLAVERLSSGNWALAEPVATADLARIEWNAKFRQFELTSTAWWPL